MRLTARRATRAPAAALALAVVLLLLAGTFALPGRVAPAPTAHSPGVPSASNPATVPFGCPGPAHCLPTSSAPSAPHRETFAGLDPAEAVGWSAVAPPPAPPGAGSGMIAVPSTDSAIVFGGENGTVLSNSTYSYSEATNRWSTLSDTHGPSPRSDFAFAFDPTTGRALLFGGLTNLVTLAVSNDTWSYVPGSNRWTRESSGSAPSPRASPAFAIDPALGVGVLYGGSAGNYSGVGTLTFSDLWEVNLTTYAWSRLAPSGLRPPPLAGAALTWDPKLSQFEMFGGCAPCSSGVWEFNLSGDRWSYLPTPGGGPPPRAYASWSFDAQLGADLLFGGSDGSVVFGDTYVFYPTNNSWVAQTTLPHPAPRTDSAAAFLDSTGNATWLVAGGTSGTTYYPDLWRLSSTSNLEIFVENASDPTHPLQEVAVLLDGGLVGFTSAAGALNLSQVNVEGATLVVSLFGFYSQSFTLWDPPGSSSVVQILLVPEPTGTVTIRVVAPSGSPLAGALVQLAINFTGVGGTRVADLGGIAHFDGVPIGAANGSAFERDYHPGYATGLLTSNATLNLTVVLVPDPYLTVTVLAGLLGAPDVPVVDAEVYLNRIPFGNTSTLGNVSGYSSLKGTVIVQASATGYVSNYTEIVLPYTGSFNATVVLVSPPAGHLTVLVFNVLNGQPIATALVTVTNVQPLPTGPVDVSQTTNATGGTEFELPSGVYSVEAGAAGFAINSLDPVPVLSGYGIPVRLYLSPLPGATVHVLVERAGEQQPLSGATVDIVGLVEGSSNSTGYFNASDLRPGAYELLVTDPGYYANETAIQFYFLEDVLRIVNLTALPAGTGGWPSTLLPSGSPEVGALALLPLLLVGGVFVLLSLTRVRRTRPPRPGPAEGPQVRRERPPSSTPPGG